MRYAVASNDRDLVCTPSLMFIYQVYGSSSFRPSYRVVLRCRPVFNLKNNLLLFTFVIILDKHVERVSFGEEVEGGGGGEKTFSPNNVTSIIYNNNFIIVTA